jgi:hypothetical protein
LVGQGDVIVGIAPHVIDSALVAMQPFLTVTDDAPAIIADLLFQRAAAYEYTAAQYQIVLALFTRGLVPATGLTSALGDVARELDDRYAALRFLSHLPTDSATVAAAFRTLCQLAQWSGAFERAGLLQPEPRTRLMPWENPRIPSLADALTVPGYSLVSEIHRWLLRTPSALPAYYAQCTADWHSCFAESPVLADMLTELTELGLD